MVLASHPGWGKNTPGRLMPQKQNITADLMGHVVRMQTSTLPMKLNVCLFIFIPFLSGKVCGWSGL